MNYYRNLIQQSIPLNLNQIASYAFDSNSVDSINAQNGTNTNISFANAGIVGNSATFNGTSSLINIADFDNFTFTAAFSMSFWIYPVANNGYLISKRNASFIEYQILLATDGVINSRFFGGGTTASEINITSNAVVPLNAWTMVTITHNGVNTNLGRNGLNVYLNGIISNGARNSAGTYTGMENTTAGVVLGRLGNLATGFYNGRMDNIKVWKGRELTANEALTIYKTLY